MLVDQLMPGGIKMACIKQAYLQALNKCWTAGFAGQLLQIQMPAWAQVGRRPAAWQANLSIEQLFFRKRFRKRKRFCFSEPVMPLKTKAAPG